MLDRFYSFAEGDASRAFALAATRITTAGLMFWWGLVKGLNTGIGQTVSDTFYGGAFSVATLLIVFGWLQVVGAICLALGLFRDVLLPIQLVMNVFVAAALWVWFIDPFWLWMPGEKPIQFGHLFYPSIIIASVSWLLIAFRGQDRWALDRVMAQRDRATA